MDRADLSKNVLRGFTAFDLFLEQHPEFRERVTFIAQLMPSRQDVPEYAEYLEKIEALVAVVNHRHGTTDWMPIDLRIEENLDQAIAYYKHYDLLIVNAMFDGMNLVAKEGPLVNERHGVSLLSENTGAHEELGEFSLSVNPFDVQEQADAMYRALTMSAEERSWRAEGLKKIVTQRHPGRLGGRPAGRHRGEVRRPPGRAHLARRASAAAARSPTSAVEAELAGGFRNPRPEPRRSHRWHPDDDRRRSGDGRPTQPSRSAPRRTRPPLARAWPRGRQSDPRPTRRHGRLNRLARQHLERNHLFVRPAPARHPERDQARDDHQSHQLRDVPPPHPRHALRSGSPARLAPSPLLSWRALMAAPRLYDLTLLLDPNVPDDRHREILGSVGSAIEGKGKLVGQHDWGMRRLAFEMDHRSDAAYHLFQFEGPKELLDQLDNSLKIADGVLRHRIIKVKPGTPPPPTPRPEAPRSARAADEPEGAVAARAAADAPAPEPAAEAEAEPEQA